MTYQKKQRKFVSKQIKQTDNRAVRRAEFAKT